MNLSKGFEKNMYEWENIKVVDLGNGCKKNIHTNGMVRYFKNGVPHREDGPAIDRSECSFGRSQWCLHGKQLTEGLHKKLTGSVELLPLLIGQGFDDFIEERLRNE